MEVLASKPSQAVQKLRKTLKINVVSGSNNVGTLTNVAGGICSGGFTRYICLYIRRYICRYIRQWHHIASGTTVRGKYLVACTSHNGGISFADPKSTMQSGLRPLSIADSTIVASASH